MSAKAMSIESFAGWLATGRRGLSSESIVAHLTGVPITGRWGLHHPHDPADLDLCVRLLTAVPLARLHFPTMRAVSPEWAALVAHWDELTALLAEEQAEGTGRAPRCYERMRELLDNARQAVPS